jgi:carboxymethylenebutenolidase
MKQAIIDLYEQYTHAPLPRRVFLSRLARLAGGAAAAAALLPLLENSYALAEQVPESDARIHTERVSYVGASGRVQGYLARPSAGGKAPGVLVIHENRGLNPHIEDVARRLAVAGFLALAPDGLSALGGTPKDEDQAREMIGKLARPLVIEDFVAGVDYLAGRPDCTGNVGCVGFCWGGGMANQVAVHSAKLKAASVFYGPVPKPEEVARIKAKLLLHYAGLDTFVNPGIPSYEEALKKDGVQYELHMYPNVNHAFHNDTAASRYNKAAAELAWSRTLAFLKQNLGG